MDYTIKDLPEQERPREKLHENGPRNLTDVELLSIILRTGIQGKNVKELSGEILDSVPVSSLADRSLEELQGFEGVSEVKAGQLIALGELARRMENEDREQVSCLSDAESMVQDMRFMDSEVLRVFHLSSGNELIAEEEFRGGIDSVELDIQKVFRSALKRGAAAMVLAHNHPSRDSAPTDADLKATREMIELGEKLGVQVLDHLIVGDSVSSLRASTELRF